MHNLHMLMQCFVTSSKALTFHDMTINMHAEENDRINWGKDK